MAWTLIAHTQVVGNGNSATVTTPPIDTTGANLIVACVAAWGTIRTSLYDSKTNNWITSTAQPSGDDVLNTYYCAAPTVGAGHTFSVWADYSPIIVMAFSGAAVSPFDQSSFNHNGGSVVSLAPGPITPSLSNALLVTALSASADASSIDSGFALTEKAIGSGQSVSGGMAWRALAAPSAINPTWQLVGPSSIAVAMLSFKGVATGSIVDLAGNFSV
jgi:hypothetical protein